MGERAGGGPDTKGSSGGGDRDRAAAGTGEGMSHGREQQAQQGEGRAGGSADLLLAVASLKRKSVQMQQRAQQGSRGEGEEGGKRSVGNGKVGRQQVQKGEGRKKKKLRPS